jgi:hypothetical protein
MNRPVRKARAIAITKAREDHSKVMLRTAALGILTSFLVYGVMLSGLFG